jgi:hypothetical protein
MTRNRTTPRKVVIIGGEWHGRDAVLVADYGPDYAPIRYAVRVDGWNRAVPAIVFLD